jgi:formylmethanofuran dehydrogenase subunit A
VRRGLRRRAVRYREAELREALQWTIGLELFLLARDPWRIVLTTGSTRTARRSRAIRT